MSDMQSQLQDRFAIMKNKIMLWDKKLQLGNSYNFLFTICNYKK